MKPVHLAIGALALAGLGAGAFALQNNAAAPEGAQPPLTVAADQPKPAPARKPGAPVKGETPMAERIATLGILNKRNGLHRDLVLHPGQGVHMNDVVVKLRACETTEAWESNKLTGAFVQVITRSPEGKWYKTFSGWLYKESPSLNVVEHPVYDVWVKDCQMHHPDTGPNTVVLTGSAAGDKETGQASDENTE